MIRVVLKMIFLIPDVLFKRFWFSFSCVDYYVFSFETTFFKIIW